MDSFLASSEYVDFDVSNIQEKACKLFFGDMGDADKARALSSCATRYRIPSTAKPE